MRKFDFKQMTFRDFWQIFRRRMWLIILPFVAAVTVGVPYSLILTPEYQADASLTSEEVGEGSILEGLVSLRLSPRERIQMIVQKIQSRKYMTQIAEKTNIVEYLRQKGRPVTNHAVRKYLRDIISVRHKGGDIIEISVTHEDPNRAMNIANAVSTVYVDSVMLERQEAVSNSLNFINEQLAEFEKRLSQVENDLVAEQKKGVLESLDKDSANFLEQLTKLDADLVDVDLRLQQAQEQLRVARSQLNSSVSRPFTNPEIIRLRTELAGLNTQLTELQNKYSDDWPDVRKLKVETAQKEAELRRAENKIPRNSQKNTSAEREYWQEEVKKLTIEKSVLTNKIADNNRKLQQMPQRQLDLARITREKAAVENMYSMLLQRKNNAMLLQATEIDQKGNVAQVFDEAVRPEFPIKPNKERIVAMAAALGLMLGVGLAFLLEFFDFSFHSINEVEDYLSLPVLGAIHKINTYEGELRAKRNKLFKLAFAGFGGLIILLVIIDVINVKFFTHNSQFLAIAQRVLSLMKKAKRLV